MASAVGADMIAMRPGARARWRGTGAFAPLVNTPLVNTMPGVRPSAPPVSLAAIVESEIIPRLMLAHGLAADAPATDRSAVSVDDIDGFAPLTLRLEAPALVARVDALRARGVADEAILVDLLAPVARRLGTWWEEDRCDFVEVTMGLWRLQEVVRELCARTPATGRFAPRRALFAAMPGDQHGFGALLVDEMFRRAGWASDVAVDASVPDLLEEVARTSLDLVGLTVSCDCHIARLASVIVSLRSVSRNPRLRVMVGGRVFVADPALAAAVGADGTAPDARGAVAVAEGLVAAAVRDAAVCG